MKVIRGLFFDLDGTLFDTATADYEAYRQALAEHDKEFTPEMHEKVFGMYSGTYLPQLYPDIDKDIVKEIQARKAEIYPEVMGLIKPHHQLVEFLKTLRPSHVTILVTTIKKVNGLALLQANGITELFDHMIFGDDVKERKPDPEVYQKALELSGLQADEALAFEDSESGISAATAAGIAVLNITIPKVKA